MTLTRYRLGDLIEIVDEKNDLGIRDFYGININKEIMPTNAKTGNLNEKKYKLLRRNRFVYSGMQTGRDKSIRISMYFEDEPVIVSPAYTTFEIKDENIILPIYFFMIFQSKEKDRLGWFYSDSSVRANLDLDRFCDIKIDLPPLDIQKKYVAIYKAMLENQASYEKGLEDLKLACDGTIDEIKKKYQGKNIIEYLNERREINSNYEYSNLTGVGNKGFIEPRGARNEKTFNRCKIFYPEDFVYNPSVISNGAIAYNFIYDQPRICTEEYIVFYTNNYEKLNPLYLFLWLKREETGRLMDFINIDSVRNRVYFKDLENIPVPLPDIKTQNYIANIFRIYLERKEINEKLKERLKNICPILIKGAVEEAKGKEA